MTAKKMVRNIEPDDPMLQYSGRIDDDDPKAPVLIYAASWVKMIFTGTSVAVTLANDSESGKIAIYYGAADSYVGLAFTELDDIIDYIKEHSVVTTTDTEIGKR